MANAELVRQGYVQVATFPPNVSYQEPFLGLQREAREAQRGCAGITLQDWSRKPRARVW